MSLSKCWLAKPVCFIIHSLLGDYNSHTEYIYMDIYSKLVPSCFTAVLSLASCYFNYCIHAHSHTKLYTRQLGLMCWPLSRPRGTQVPCWMAPQLWEGPSLVIYIPTEFNLFCRCGLKTRLCPFKSLRYPLTFSQLLLRSCSGTAESSLLCADCHHNV